MAILPIDDDADFKFDSHLLPFMQTVPFFAELSRHMRKLPTKALPTAGVTYDPKTDDIVLYWNNDFMKRIEAREDGDAEIHGLLTHEFYHIVFRHLSARRKTPHKAWNIATDAAINSLIMYNEDGSINKQAALPPGCILPGQPPTDIEGVALSKQAKDAAPLTHLIEKWPTLKASEWYFAELYDWVKEQVKNCPVHGDGPKKNKPDNKKKNKKGDKPDKNKGKNGEGDDASPGTQGEPDPSGAEGDGEGEGDAGEGGKGNQPGGSEPGHGEGAGCTCGGPSEDGDGFDLGGSGQGSGDHDPWDDVGETSREYIDARIADMVGKAVKAADRQSNGWGNIPANMRAEIRASVEHEIDWRAELRNWLGTTCRADRTTSIKRINKRYPYIFSGTKRTYRPKFLICGDQSGSVGDDAWELFFGELTALTRHIDIDVVYFDTECNERDIFTWKKGRPLPPRARREKCGGTDFDAPTRMVNQAKNRGRWDGVCIMSDGECSKPEASRLRRLWVICPDRKLLFDTTDRVITLKKVAPKKGPWR